MASNQQPKATPRKGSGSVSEDNSEWADSLRQLYDSVVEEELPDSFKDLLAKLDNDS